MGVLQALETIKLIIAPANLPRPFAPSLLIFSALSSPPFRSVRIRSRRGDCAVCSSRATITSDTIGSDAYSYQQFCGLTPPTNLLDSSERISARDYSETRHQPHALIDVRDPVQFGLCHLPNSINIPLEDFPRSNDTADTPQWLVRGADLPRISPDIPVHVVCRLGQDSQVAVRRLKQLGYAAQGRYVGDIRDGYRGWKKEVDPDWPEY
jgi:adenylyltransferase/sulfurtransferase